MHGDGPAAQVSYDDAIDPPDNLEADYSFIFHLLLEPKINEFSASTTGTDVEFIEVLAILTPIILPDTLLEIEGDTTSTPGYGMIDHVIPIGTTNAGGLYLQNLLANDLENGTVTLLLVKDFTGALSNDIDANDDGVIDTPYWSAIVDAVAVNDGGVGDLLWHAIPWGCLRCTTFRPRRRIADSGRL